MQQAVEAAAAAEKKQSQAELALSRARHELGTALQRAKTMRLEQEEAEVIVPPHSIASLTHFVLDVFIYDCAE